MNHIISSFSFPENKKQVLEEFLKIAQREGKSKSELNMELIEEHVKQHAEGNSTFKIEDFQDPEFKAMPATLSSDDKWDYFIRNHMNEEELDELDKKNKFIAQTIEAKKWLNKHKK